MHCVLRHISSIFGARFRQALLAVVLATATVAPQLAVATTAGAEAPSIAPSAPASFPECLYPPPGQMSGDFSLLTSADFAPCAFLSYLINPAVLGSGLVDDGIYQATGAEQTALSDLEAQAVANTLSDHDLPSSAADAVMTWGQADAEAELWALIVQAIETPAASRTADQQGAVDWLASVVQAEQVGAAQDAVQEYADWAGTSADDLSATPEPNPGYCTYTSPDGTYTPAIAQAEDPLCSAPCLSVAGCSPVTPSSGQFEQWGQDDESNGLQSLFDSTSYAQGLSAIQTAETFGGAVAGAAATGAVISTPMSSLFIGSALQTSLFAVYGTNNLGYGVGLSGLGAFDTAAEAAEVAGAVTAGGVASIVSVVILAVTTAVLEGINVFEAADLPSDLEGNLSTAESTTPDVSSLLQTQSGVQSLYGLFVGATMPAEPLYLCSGSEAPGNSEGAVPLSGVPGAPVGSSTSAPAGICNTPPIPAQSQSDPVFCVQENGSLSSSTDPCVGQPSSDVPESASGPGPGLASSITWVDGAAPNTSTDSAWLTSNWFVETATPSGGTPATVQTLEVRYADWSGTEQTAWLIDTPRGYTFVGVAEQSSSAPPFDPSTCVADGTCWTSPYINFVGADGNHYSAWVQGTTSAATNGTPGPTTPPPGLALGATVTSLTEQVTLTATASADPVEGAPETFSATGVSQYGLPLTYSWQFQQLAPPGGFQLCETIDPTTGASSPSPCWSSSVTGANVSFTWPTTGTYLVQVTASDAYGNSATDTFSVTVGDVPPTLSVSSGCPGVFCSGAQPVTLPITVTHAGANDAETVAVSWGDGATSTYVNGIGGQMDAVSGTELDLSATHTYAQGGLYKVTVTGTDQGGGTASATVYEVGPGTVVSQAINFVPAPDQQPYGAGAFPIAALGGVSGEPVTLSSTTPSVCSVSNPVARATTLAAAVTSAQVDLLSAGTCTIAANQAGTGELIIYPPFSAAPQVTQSFTITPARLTIFAQPESVTYGSTPTYSAGYGGFVNADTSSVVSGLSCKALDGNGQPVGPETAVGQYTITCSGAQAPGYTISYESARLDINPARLTVTANNETMTYGGPVPNLSASYSGLAGGDSANSLSALTTCQTPANSRSPVGTYPVDCQMDDANYQITRQQGTLTVTPTQLTITASSPDTTFGQPVPAITPTDAGFKNGDTASALNPAPVCSTPANASSPVGSYSSSCSGATARNYAINYVNGTVTIEAAGSAVTPATASTTVTTADEPAAPGSATTGLGPNPVTTTTTITTAAGSTGGTGGGSSAATSGSSGRSGPSSSSSAAGSSSSGGTTVSGGSSGGSSMPLGGRGAPGGTGEHGTSTTNPPKVASLSPAVGPLAGGTRVVIKGLWLEDVKQVQFGPHDARFKMVSAKQVVAWSPAGAGSVALVLKTSAGTSDPAKGDQHDDFSYLARSQVLRLSPANGPASGGTAVVIRGKGFEDVARVTFGSRTVHFKVVSAEEIMARSPQETGIVAVVVTTPGGPSAKDDPDRFTFTPRRATPKKGK
jgi:MBG domain (YGX type)/IPT/TIG domain/PKD domain